MENNHVSFWGRTLDEYTKMFSLSDLSPRTKILSIADGPSTFNLELKRNGVHVVSVDPVYKLPIEKLRACFEESYLFNREFFYTYPEKFNLKNNDEVEGLLSSVTMPGLPRHLALISSARSRFQIRSGFNSESLFSLFFVKDSSNHRPI